MSTITISKKVYTDLKKRAEAFNRMVAAADPVIFLEPSVRSRREVMNVLRLSKKYNKEFLASISRGLRRSSFFTK